MILDLAAQGERASGRRRESPATGLARWRARRRRPIRRSGGQSDPGLGRGACPRNVQSTWAFRLAQGVLQAELASANKTGSRSEAHQGGGSMGESGVGARRRTLAARRCGARGGPAAGRLPASGLLGSAPGVPVRETRRSGRSEELRRCGIAMAEQLTGGGRGLNSGAGVARIRASELGEVPGHGARLLRGSGKSGVWRSSEATAAQV